MSQDFPTDAHSPWLTDDEKLTQLKRREAEIDVIPNDWNRGAPDHPSHATNVFV